MESTVSCFMLAPSSKLLVNKSVILRVLYDFLTDIITMFQFPMLYFSCVVGFVGLWSCSELMLYFHFFKINAHLLTVAFSTLFQGFNSSMKLLKCGPFSYSAEFPMFMFVSLYFIHVD